MVKCCKKFEGYSKIKRCIIHGLLVRELGPIIKSRVVASANLKGLRVCKRSKNIAQSFTSSRAVLQKSFKIFKQFSLKLLISVITETVMGKPSKYETSFTGDKLKC